MNQLEELAQLDRQYREASASQDFRSAEASLLRSIAIEQELGDQAGIAADYGNLGNVYLNMNRFDDAEIAIRKGLTLDEGAGRQASTAIDYYGLARVYQSRSEYEQAEQYASHSLDLFQANKQEEYVPAARQLLDAIRWSAPIYRDKTEGQ
jgi:tetratricopeptide (TPR) repeat protein